MITHLHRSLATALVLGALAAAPAVYSATVPELLASLRVEVEKANAEAKANKNTGFSSFASDVERQLSRLESAITRESFEEADQAVNQLALMKLPVEAKEKISQIQREIPKAAEERYKAYVTQVGATIEKAGKACLEAKTENDLDPILVELSALKKNRGDSSSGTNDARMRVVTRLEGAIRFVSRWQDYLAQSARGFEMQARNVLRDLADPNVGGTQYYPILARAEIVARLGKDYTMTSEEIVREIKNLNDLPKAITELTRLSKERNTSGNFESVSIVNELNTLARAHAAFQSGNYGSALAAMSNWEVTNNVRSPETMRLKTMVLLEVLPRYLELSGDPKPNAGENPSDFLLRLATESAAKGEWPRVARALDAYRLTAFGYRQQPAWITADYEACQQLIAGQNLEKAGRIVPAILAYQRAVKTVGKYSPHEAAASRLAALEKENPAAFTEAGKDPQIRELLEAISTGANSRPGTIPAPGFAQ